MAILFKSDQQNSKSRSSKPTNQKPQIVESVSAGAACDPGLMRDGNEDRCYFRSFTFTGELGQERGLIAAVADGMGGHSAGEAASERAIQVFAARFSHMSGGGMSRKMSPDWPGLIREAFVQANKEVVAEASRWAGQAGMGTTLTAIVIIDGVMYIGHIGDSRAYLIRNERVIRLTQDHTWVAQCVRDGTMTPEEAEMSDRRGQLTSAIGLRSEVLPDIDAIGLRPDDRIILCTDGITEMLSDDDIMAIGSFPDDVQRSAQNLINAANKSGGYDNSAAVVIACRGERQKNTFSLPKLQKKPPAWALTALIVIGVLLLIDVIFLVARYAVNGPHRQIPVVTAPYTREAPPLMEGTPIEDTNMEKEMLDLGGRPVEVNPE